ncbi:MAG TPA: NUDIX hydrolase [Xanthomonadaceae bacterium]|nr:NUDIX hydrolase [Xanthomonadaceae bacterium]
MNELSAPTDGEFRPDVTVATIVLRSGCMLIVEEQVRGRLVLNQPAGHLEDGESLVAAARRETFEETGWHVTPTDFVGAYLWRNPEDGCHFLRFAFAARADRHEPDQPLDEGIVRALWMTPSELREAGGRLRSPLVLAVIDDFLAGRRLPLSAVREIP